MSGSSQNLKLGEAASRFLVSLPSEEVGINQQVIYRFVRWFGRERPLAEIAADEIANYAQQISSADADYLRKLDLVRTFLAHARKAGWIKNNLAMHLRTKKGKPRLATGTTRQASPTIISLTQQGYNEIKGELEVLKGQRPQIVEEIRRAAQDKDFRENAPLDAARERLSHLEGRIRELEETLKSATLVKEKTETSPKLGVGDSIVLLDLASGEELHYTIVSPREVDPARGRISSATPLGKAIIGRGHGDIVEIVAPAGRLRYRIEQVKR
jgi:transcription elongation factor GreA